MLGFKDVTPDQARWPAVPRYLAKADLTTQMVTEMTSLQGIIGARIRAALGRGPRGGGGDRRTISTCPGDRSWVSLLRWLTGIDSLTGLFAVGPCSHGHEGSLRSATCRDRCRPAADRAWHGLRPGGSGEKICKDASPSRSVMKCKLRCLDFITGRLSVVLKDMGYQV